jgi:hypothetical protein
MMVACPRKAGKTLNCFIKLVGEIKRKLLLRSFPGNPGIAQCDYWCSSELLLSLGSNLSLSFARDTSMS